MPILQWLDRGKHVRAAEAVPYRLLEADDAHSAGDAETPNMLIQGDNLEALKALLPYYAGRVKCINIDAPPTIHGAHSNITMTISNIAKARPNDCARGPPTQAHAPSPRER
jgi:adenine-specific DNA-methyltransferase